MEIANILGVLVTLSFFIFYTAYDKSAKKIVLRTLRSVIFCEKGLEWTLVECNKAISLSGLTLMLLSFLPHFSTSNKEQLTLLSIVLLLAHSVFSVIKFYGCSFKSLLREKSYRQFALLLGWLALFAFIANYLAVLSGPMLAVITIFLAFGHFYGMEMDYKGDLQVRPYAYLPFAIAPIIILYIARDWLYGLS